MRASYKVQLFPISPTSGTEDLEFQDVDLGFNQMGWMVISDRNRDVIASFAPNSVRFATKIGEAEVGKLIEFETRDEEPVIN